MDLVRCDGASLLYQNKVWRLGSSPTDAQIFDIASWLSESHMDSTGLSTDNMYEVGYLGALALGEIVCGMASSRITSYDVLFWFRSHAAAEVRWGGAKHDGSEVDDGRRMHPRSSFKAFLEVVKMRSSPWSDVKMDAIHSLQLILRGTLDDDENARKKMSLDSRIRDIRLEGMLELEAVTNEMVRLIESAMVPILAMGVDGMVNSWNRKIAELAGLPIDHAIGKNLLTLMKDYSAAAVKKMIYSALKGNEEQNVQF